MFDIIGKNIRNARLSRGWSQRFVASQINVSHQSISRLENGFPVSCHLLKKVTGLLQIPLNNVYQEKNTDVEISPIIPDDVMNKMLLSSQPLVECIFREAVLRYKQQLKHNGILLQDDIERIINQYINEKKYYTKSDLIYAGMISNQETIKRMIQLRLE